MINNQAHAREILENAAERMTRRGEDENRIKQISRSRGKEVADDILAMGTAKSYDVSLVDRLGRRNDPASRIGSSQ